MEFFSLGAGIVPLVRTARLCAFADRLTLFLFLLPLGLLQAQSPGFLHYGLEEGLPSNMVYCAVQDHEGYMWFGTDKGLSRFDGERFKQYGSKDGLPREEVLSLYEDQEQRLWISCFPGELAYRKGGRFFNAGNSRLIRMIQPGYINNLFFESRDSALWIVSVGKDPSRLKRDKLQHLALKEGDLRIEQIGQIDTMLIGTNFRAIFEVLPGDTFHHVPLYFIDKLKEENFRGPSSISGNRILFGLADSTLLFEYKDRRLLQLGALPRPCSQLYTDSQGRFWACYPDGGVTCFDNRSRDLGNPRAYLPGIKILRIYEDRNGDFWFLSADQGIYRLPRYPVSNWSQSDGLRVRNILSLAASGNEQVLAGDDQGNVYLISPGKRPDLLLQAPPGRNAIRKIQAGENNTFYLATDKGFYACKKTAGRIDQQPLRTPDRGAGKSILSDGADIWLGSSGNLMQYERSSARIVQSWSGRTFCLSKDQQGRLWYGTPSGLFDEYRGFAHNWGMQYPQLAKGVTALCAAGKDRLLAVTQEEGLLSLTLEKEKIIRVSAYNSILKTPIFNIKDLQYSEDSTIWLGTNRGLFVIYPEGNVDHIDTRRGIAGNDIKALALTPEHVWLATDKGISLLRRKDLSQALSDLKTALVELRYQVQDSLLNLDFSGRSQGDLQMRIPAGATALEADLAAFSPAQYGEFRYRHILDKGVLPFPWYTFPTLFSSLADALGLGQQSDTVLTNRATYNLGISLPAGKYAFESQALNYSGKGKESVSWELLILPHWYETIWIWILLLVLLLFWLWRIYRLRVNYIGIEVSASQWQLQALRSQINPHFIGNSINSIQQFFYPPDPLKASEYIHLFTQLLRQTIHFSEQDFIPFSEELKFSQSYLDMIRLRYGDTFQYEISVSEQILDETPFPAMILQPVLENATIHGLSPSGVSLLKMAFYLEGPRLFCKISDNGIGIRESKALKRLKLSGHKSKGTEILNNKIQMLNRAYQVQMQLEVSELSDLPGDQPSGTLVLISFIPAKRAVNA